MNEEKRTVWRVAPAAEIAIGVLALVLWIVFFCYRTCFWDTVALGVWAVVILLCALLLFRAERRLRAGEERQE